MIFETKRLVVRKLTLQDLPIFAELHADEKVMGMIPASTLTKAESEFELKRLISRYSALATDLTVWGITEKSTHQLIGLCAVVNREAPGSQIGYRFQQKAWGKGYGTESTKGLIHYLFHQTETQLLTADVAKTNKASKKILEKFMTFKGEVVNPEDQDMVWRYELKREEYLTKSGVE
jgi:ribosomal-protein-alanine N-acetyltransferase